MFETALSWETPSVDLLQAIISRSKPRIAKGIISKEPDKADSITEPMSKTDAQRIQRKLSKRQAGSVARRMAVLAYLREYAHEENPITGMELFRLGKFNSIVKILNNDLNALYADGFLRYSWTVNSNNQDVRGYWAK